MCFKKTKEEKEEITMKKRISKLAVVVLTVIMMAMSLAGCKKVECDGCGEKKSCTKYEILGEELNFCKDCKEDLEALGSLFK